MLHGDSIILFYSCLYFHYQYVLNCLIIIPLKGIYFFSLSLDLRRSSLWVGMIFVFMLQRYLWCFLNLKIKKSFIYFGYSKLFIIGNSSPYLLLPSSLLFNVNSLIDILIGLTLYFLSMNLPFTFSIAFSFYSPFCIICSNLFRSNLLWILTFKDYTIPFLKCIHFFFNIPLFVSYSLIALYFLFYILIIFYTFSLWCLSEFSMGLSTQALLI